LLPVCKAAKDAQTRLASVEAKCKKDVAAVEAKTAKAEKSLAEAKRQQATCEQAIVECIDALSMRFGSKDIFPVKIFLFLHRLCSLLNVGCRAAAEQIGEIYKLHAEQAEDPLLDAIGVLEFNCRNARDVLQCTQHVLTRLFFEFFPKKKKSDVPTTNLKRLVDVFDTIEDPTLQLKRLSVKRGAKGWWPCRCHMENRLTGPK
jgi:hypothetical protein